MTTYFLQRTPLHIEDIPVNIKPMIILLYCLNYFTVFAQTWFLKGGH